MKNLIIILCIVLVTVNHSAKQGSTMKRLSTLQLIPGMVVARNVYNFDEELIFRKGTVLTDKLITKLDLYGILTIFVEDSIPVTSEPDFAPREPSHSERIRKSPEFQKFKSDYEASIQDFRLAVNFVVEKNVKLDVHTLLQNALRLVTQNTGYISILDMLQNMRKYDDSTFTHCMNVGLISNVLATWLRMKPEEIELATACGLFHDIGKIMMPIEIITKPGKLSEAEYEQIKKHPEAGYKILLEQDVDDHVRQAALMHHERMDGTGYPAQLTGKQIDKYARIVAIADVYDAMTAARCYRGPICPFHVIEIFEAEGFQRYDVKYLLTFMENVANTYIRSRCRLNNDKEGDIIYINKGKLSRPIVQCGTDYINLAEIANLNITELL